MRKRILFSLVVIAFLGIVFSLNVKASESKLLYIYDDAVLNGSNVQEIIQDLSNNDIFVSAVPIKANMTFSQTAEGITKEKFTDVIIQDSFNHVSNNSSDLVTGIQKLKAVLDDTADTRFFVVLPWKELTNDEYNSIATKVTAVTQESNVFVHEKLYIDHLKVAKDKDIKVMDGGKMTTAGELLVGGSYCRLITSEKIQGLTTYPGLDNTTVATIVGILNEESSQDTQEPVDSVPDEDVGGNEGTPDNPEEGSDLEETATVEVSINREPIMKFIGEKPEELTINISDLEKAGLKSVKIFEKDSKGKVIVDFKNTDTNAPTSKDFTIKSKTYLKKDTYQKFYIVAQDVDGCALREFFKVKLLDKEKGGSYYKINRAPRVKPLVKKAESANDSDTIAMHVVDNSGVSELTPTTVKSGNYVQSNLYATGKYKGFSGIKDKYDWQNVNGTTTTGNKTYIKKADTKYVAAGTFFKHAKLASGQKVLIKIGKNKYKYRMHTVDTSGLKASRNVILTLSKDDYLSGDDGDRTSTTKEFKEDVMDFNYLKFKTNREPRLKFDVGHEDTLYVEIRDQKGIAVKKDNNKNYVYPVIYKGKNKKNGTLLKDVKRPDNDKTYTDGADKVYRIGINKKDIAETGKTDFYIIARDDSKEHCVIKEHFTVKKKSGSGNKYYQVDRAPRTSVVTTKENETKVGIFAEDNNGVYNVLARTIKKKGKYDALGGREKGWNGTNHAHWSQVKDTVEDNKYVAIGITEMKSKKNFFKKPSKGWTGKDPKKSKGKYKFVIRAEDKNGLASLKTLVVDTSRVVTGSSSRPISKPAKSTRKKSNASKAKKSGSKKNKSNTSKPKKNKSNTSKSKNKKSNKSKSKKNKSNVSKRKSTSKSSQKEQKKAVEKIIKNVNKYIEKMNKSLNKLKAYKESGDTEAFNNEKQKFEKYYNNAMYQVYRGKVYLEGTAAQNYLTVTQYNEYKNKFNSLQQDVESIKNSADALNPQ